MLVLLIIFMVTAPLIQQGVEVSAARGARQGGGRGGAEARPLHQGRQEPLARHERGRRGVPFDDLEDKLRANTRAQKDHELYLMADKSLPYGFVVDVMATVQRAGIVNVGMITNPAADEAREARTEARRRWRIPVATASAGATGCGRR